MQIKVALKFLGWAKVKKWCGQSGDGTLKLTVSQKMSRCNKLIYYMLVQIQES